LILAACGSFASDYGQLTLPFEAYTSGTFVSRASHFNLLVSSDGAFFALAGKPGAMVHMRILGANPNAQAIGEGRLSSHGNYLIGGNPAKWRTNVEQFGSVRVHNTLPNVDVLYYGGPGKLEYDFIVHPGSSVDAIRLRFEGSSVRPSIAPNGDLLLKTAAAEIVEHKPIVDQDGKRIAGNFTIEPGGDVRFQVGDYDRSRPLRIDPVITYSTYLGGTSGDSPNAVFVDAAGNAYITGATSSYNFPVTAGSLQTSFPSTTETVAFVAKLNPTGTGLVYTTFLGGSGVNGGDSANAIAVDASGNAYVAGTTGSANFPVTQGALSTTLNGPTDAFVAKINPAGTALIYGTYLGGSGNEIAAGLAIDSAGDAYVTGSTGSTNFPVSTGAPQTVLKSANDAFITKLNPSGSAVVYSTYLGGSAEDDGHAIAVDGSGNAYITGATASTDFPVTTGAFQAAIGPSNVVFAAKLNAAGTALTYATYLGGSGGDTGNAIAVDATGDAYIAGTTFSADFPVTAGVLGGTAPGGAGLGHAFLAKFNSTGAALVYSTYLGGANADGANGIALDAYGDATLTGFTYSSNFPVSTNPAEPVANFSPAGFLTTINQAGTAIIYSTMLGATGSTVAQAVTLDSSNNAYVTGYTASTTLPATSGGFQSNSATASPQANTGFVMKLNLASATTCALSFSPGTVSMPVAGTAVTVSVVAPAGCAWEVVTSSTWLTVNSPSSGVGPGTVTITAGSNEMSLSTRTALATAGSAALTVNQVAGSCSTPQIYPASPESFGQAGGTGSVAVSVPPGCQVTASSSLSWVTINSGASATGDDVVTFTVAADTATARSGTITIAGQPYTISQYGLYCATSLTPTASSISANAQSVTATLVAPSGCSWTAASNAGWLTVTPAAGSGNATLTFAATANTTGASRNATVTVPGFASTVTQAIPVYPSLNIDAPAPNASLTGIVAMSGWALENTTSVGPNAVQSVTVSVDGTQVGTATYGSVRADVCNNYPGRLGCPNVGWTYSLNASAFSVGSHVLQVTAVDSAGNSTPSSVNFTTTAPPLPSLNIDAPAPNSTLAGTVAISGWALENMSVIGAYAIQAVTVFVDGTQVGTASYGTARADVCNNYPGRPGCPNVGWSYSLNVSSLAAGSHVLKIVATDAAANSNSSQVNFTIAAVQYPSLTVDAPGPNATLSGTVAMSGWALENTMLVGSHAVQSVTVFVDSTQVGTATYGTARQDVCNNYPGRLGCPNVGWTYSLNVNALTAGSHVLKVVATDSAGNSTSSQLNFTAVIPQVVPYVVIDAPPPNATLSGTVAMSGWALENNTVAGPYAVQSVTVLVDGTQVGTATYGTARVDVCNNYPGRLGCPNVGWTYSLNVNSLTSGSHVLKVVATDSAGNSGSSQLNFTAMVTQIPYVTIDAPGANATLSGTASLSGWALESNTVAGPYAVASVTVFVDGTQIGTATYGTARMDVCNNYPGRLGCPNVGWTYSLNVNTLTSGAHVLKIVATDSAGNSGSSQVNFTAVVTTVPSITIDAPAPNATLAGTVSASGWAIENKTVVGPYAVQSVTVFVDGTQVGTATYGTARVDVCNAYPGRLGCPNVGWSYSLNVSSLSSGSHTLKFVATDTAGNSTSAQNTFTK
jgi:hypothetical protein